MFGKVFQPGRETARHYVERIWREEITVAAGECNFWYLR